MVLHAGSLFTNKVDTFIEQQWLHVDFANEIFFKEEFV